jgi:hypothetical protein
MSKKRAEALRQLDEFRAWYLGNPAGQGNQLLYLGLTRDILRGTEERVDQLIENLTEKNGQALLLKLSLNA